MSQTDFAGALPRVLVVDDSRIVRATVKKHLSGSFDIIEEPDGEAGWQRLSADPTVQVMISDLTMPRLDGFGLLERVRKAADHRVRTTPVIIISGEEDAETKQHAVEKGANDFITKSTDRAEMVARVAAAVQLAKASRELKTAEEVQAKTATTDTKTGLATQHLLEIEADKALAHAMRHQTEVTLLLFELDEFAGLRQRLGDTVADQLMGMISKLLAGKLRKEETLARLDGPRFGLVLPSPLNGSLVLADRLRQTIAGAKVNFRGEQIKLTASVGVASSDRDGSYAYATLFEAARARAKLASQAGGNRVQAPNEGPPHHIDVATAINMIQAGNQAAVLPHLKKLLNELSPLLDLAEQEMGPDWQTRLALES